jgi:hypothetical protein
MSSSFYANPCKLDADTIVTQLAWSNIDPIAAVACNTVDDRDRETHQILFINNEVRLHQMICDNYSSIYLCFKFANLSIAFLHSSHLYVPFIPLIIITIIIINRER